MLYVYTCHDISNSYTVILFLYPLVFYSFSSSSLPCHFLCLLVFPRPRKVIKHIDNLRVGDWYCYLLTIPFIPVRKPCYLTSKIRQFVLFGSLQPWLIKPPFCSSTFNNTRHLWNFLFYLVMILGIIIEQYGEFNLAAFVTHSLPHGLLYELTHTLIQLI